MLSSLSASSFLLLDVIFSFSKVSFLISPSHLQIPSTVSQRPPDDRRTAAKHRIWSRIKQGIELSKLRKKGWDERKQQSTSPDYLTYDRLLADDLRAGGGVESAECELLRGLKQLRSSFLRDEQELAMAGCEPCLLVRTDRIVLLA